MTQRLPPIASLFVLLAMVALAPVASAAGLTAEVDRSRLGLGETLELRVIADGWPGGGDPDFAPLEDDFEIVDRSVSNRMSIINGKMSQTREWGLTLAPRRAGALRIPGIELAGQGTAPVDIEVLAEPVIDPEGGPPPVRLQARVDADAPYVQQAVVYRVRVLYRDQPRRMSLGEPEAEGATIEPGGDDRSGSEMIDGVRYTVIERPFLVTPQRSGPLTIRSPRLEAVLPDDRPGVRTNPLADLEGMFGGRVFQGFPGLAETGSGRRLVLRGEDLTLDVRPQPPGSAAPWLPAESVQLVEEWTPAPPLFRVGEPVTRTLTITARGATAAALPDIDLGAPDGAHAYPEQPRIEDLPGATGAPAALKTLKVALVPTRGGSLTLPEIRLPWWDIAEDRARVAVIPARTVQVEAAASGASDPSAMDLGASAVDDSALSAPRDPDWQDPGVGQPDPLMGSPWRVAPVPQTSAEPTAVTAEGMSPWIWVSLALGLGWLLTLGWWLLQRRRARGKPAAGSVTAADTGSGIGLSRAQAAARVAFRGGDPRAARSALLAWAGARWPEAPPRGLGEVALRLGSASRPLLEILDRAIYAAADRRDAESAVLPAWDGAGAWRELEPMLRDAGQPREETRATLPALYPQGV